MHSLLASELARTFERDRVAAAAISRLAADVSPAGACGCAIEPVPSLTELRPELCACEPVAV